MYSLKDVTSGRPLFRTGCVIRPLAIVGLSASLMIHANADPPRTDGGAMSSIQATKSISIGLGTDLPAWDLCWSDHALMLQEAIARKAIARMDSTDGSAYLIEIRNLRPFPRDWRPADLGKDLVGRPITRSQMARVRDSYAIEVERALIGIADQIRSSRPPVSVAFAGFTQFDRGWVESQLRLGRTEIPYRRLAEIQSDPARSYELSTRSRIEVPESQDLDPVARVLSSPTDEMEAGDAVENSLDDTDAPRGGFAGDSLAVDIPGQPSHGSAGAGRHVGAPIRGGGADNDTGSTGTVIGSVDSVGTILLDGDAGGSPMGGNGSAVGSGSENFDAGSEHQPESAGEQPADESAHDSGQPDRVLRPGDGFNELWNTALSPLGSPTESGSDAEVIAHWDVVPRQTVSSTDFHVGIVAFHVNGVDRVEFFLNGGQPVVVHEMDLNSRTGVYEYWATVSPTRLLADGVPDGPIELRAIAYPKTAGVPTVLEPLWLNSNAGGTLAEITLWCAPWGSDSSGTGTELNPFRQPYRALRAAMELGSVGSADGSTIFLAEGEYCWGGLPETTRPCTRDRWAIVRSAPGCAADSVVFSEVLPRGFQTELLAVSGVRIAVTISTNTTLSSKIWLDDVVIQPPDPAISAKTFYPYYPSNWTKIFATRSLICDSRDAFVDCQIVRDCEAVRLASDAFQCSRLVVNSCVDGIDSRGTTYHPDVFQLMGDVDRAILYGVRAINVRAQGIFVRDTNLGQGIAIVNVLISQPWGDEVGYFSQLASPIPHLVVRGLSMPNAGLWFRSDSVANVDITGCQFWHVSAVQMPPVMGPPILDPDWFRYCHFGDNVSGYYYGLDPVFGAPDYTCPIDGDFSPLATSPLLGVVPELVAPVDLFGQSREVPDTVGAIY